MSKRIQLNEVSNYTGQDITLVGFVQTVRKQGSICFIILRDRTGTIQAVVTKDAPEAFGLAEKLSLESVVALNGTVKEEKQAPGGIELGVTEINVLSQADPELPIPVVEKDENETDQSVRLDWRWLDLRKPQKQLVFKVWTLLEEAFREYWTREDYLQIHSPKMMSSPSESGAELFEVAYFDRKAYLAQSPQFYKQMAMAAGFEKVFEIGPVFRAEPSFTSRHATEFTGYDAEISYVASHQDVIDELQKTIHHALDKIAQVYSEQIKTHYDREVIVPSLPFPQVTMAQAKELLNDAGVLSESDGDLSPEEERKLSEIIKEKEGHEFVFVTDYPITVRPFYHMRQEENPNLTKSFDLLWNGLEVTTGAQREHRYDILVKQAQEKGLALPPIQHYLNFFKYGCPPHGGYGLGPERLLIKLFNVENIREVSYLYRGVKRLTP